MRQTGKTISLEAAKLLGVPFTTGKWHTGYKFVHGEHGLELWVRWRDEHEWRQAINVGADKMFRPETTLHIVEFPEGPEASDASHE